MAENNALAKVLRIAQILSKENHVLLFSTIGTDGGPRSRYMGAFLIQDKSKLWLISPAKSCKVQQILSNSRAQVLFFDKAYRRVLTLSGHARMVTDESIRRNVYQAQKTLKKYPVFDDNFGVIDFVLLHAEYLDLDVSDDVVIIPIAQQ